jgi:uncharacterized protein with HEPN domain
VSHDRVYLAYILECITNIEELTAQGRVALESSKHQQAALLYYLQTMAEATQRLSEDRKAAYPDVDWMGISGFRNRLVHGYLEVNMNIVWSIIEKHLPGLKLAAEMMLKTFDDNDTN